MAYICGLSGRGAPGARGAIGGDAACACAPCDAPRAPSARTRIEDRRFIPVGRRYRRAPTAARQATAPSRQRSVVHDAPLRRDGAGRALRVRRGRCRGVPVAISVRNTPRWSSPLRHGAGERWSLSRPIPCPTWVRFPAAPPGHLCEGLHAKPACKAGPYKGPPAPSQLGPHFLCGRRPRRDGVVRAAVAGAGRIHPSARGICGAVRSGVARRKDVRQVLRRPRTDWTLRLRGTGSGPPLRSGSPMVLFTRLSDLTSRVAEASSLRYGAASRLKWML